MEEDAKSEAANKPNGIHAEADGQYERPAAHTHVHTNKHASQGVI